MAPQRADFVLTTNVPDRKIDVMKLDCFNIEALSISMLGLFLGFYLWWVWCGLR